MDLYQQTALENRAVLGETPEFADLVRFATLAANGHNTQPWKFRIEANSIALLPDLSRRTPVVDPDDHHLFASLGCAAANLELAGLARGLKAHIKFDPPGNGALTAALEKTKPRETSLFQAIPKRQCARSVYDGRAVPAADLKKLEQAAGISGVRVLMLSDKKAIEGVLEYIIEGNTRQFSDQAFLGELRHWIRFNKGHALKTRDGLYGGATGSPPIPAWLGKMIFPVIASAKTENEKIKKQVRSSAGIAVFSADRDKPEGWIRAGMGYQRFALQATALGLKNAFLNQPVEMAPLRGQFAEHLGLKKRRPDLVVRFGYGPQMPYSLRRPLVEVLV